MKRVFVSQPMGGKTDVEILATRAQAAKAAQDYLGEEVKVLNSFWPGTGRSSLQLLARSIDMLAQADLVYFAPGWKSARGCKIEHDAAVAYGLSILEGEGDSV